ncbi:MAG: phosphate ABC transporter permease subunit PstC [Solirubrobacterales bacterium]|nr:phosphate ABC transporter permease subunit PstC [Solirubrobacterales bacterium]
MFRSLFREPWSDHRAERTLGAVAVFLCSLVILIVVFVLIRAMPTLQHNNLVGWLLPGGPNVDEDIRRQINTGLKPTGADYALHAWPLVYATILTTGFSVLFGLVFALLSAIFIVEFAPARLRRVVVPVVRLLAAVPSVIYGLIGILVLAPFVADTFISLDRKNDVAYVVQLSGTNLLVATMILTVMITPIMVAIITEALYAVPRSWKEGALALGVNRWRSMWTVSVRAVRPAIIAAAVLATARALGEAIMLSMVSGSRGFAPNPLDGLTFFFEPLRPLGATIAENVESLNAPAIRSSIYAFALLLLLSSLVLSLGGYFAKQPMRKYGVRI